MSDLVFITATVAFFLAANGFVTLCSRILGSGSTSTTRPGTNDSSVVGPGGGRGATGRKAEVSTP
jgi:hypothetical protein